MLRNITQEPAIGCLVTGARGKKETFPVCLAIMHQGLFFLFVGPVGNVTRANVTRLMKARAQGCHKAVLPVTMARTPAKFRQQPLP
jgi:hypothetical protein